MFIVRIRTLWATNTNRGSVDKIVINYTVGR